MPAPSRMRDKQGRAFSHGCMRVQDPVRFAEIILGEDKGWSSAQVQALLSGPLNNEITLSHQIPVHVTYFTAVVDADGKVRFTGDPYGKDARLATALAGRPVNLDIPPEPIDTQLGVNVSAMPKRSADPAAAKRRRRQTLSPSRLKAQRDTLLKRGVASSEPESHTRTPKRPYPTHIEVYTGRGSRGSLVGSAGRRIHDWRAREDAAD